MLSATMFFNELQFCSNMVMGFELDTATFFNLRIRLNQIIFSVRCSTISNRDVSYLCDIPMNRHYSLKYSSDNPIYNLKYSENALMRCKGRP